MPPHILYYSLVGAFLIHGAEAASGSSSSSGNITSGGTSFPAKWVLIPGALIIVILVCICYKKVGCSCCDQVRMGRYRNMKGRELPRAEATGETGATDTLGLGNMSTRHRPGDTVDNDGVIGVGRDLEVGYTWPAKAETILPPYSPPILNSAYKEPDTGGSSALHYAPPSYLHPAYPSAHFHADMETFPLTTHQA